MIHPRNTQALRPCLKRGGMSTTYRTVLLVEDDPDHRLLISFALEGSAPGILVRSVGSGELALEYLLGQPPADDLDDFPRPCLVILNLGLPGISGFDVLRVMRETRALREIPVLVLTVSSEDRDRRLALSLGAVAFLPKPADFSSIGPVVRDLLEATRDQAVC